MSLQTTRLKLRAWRPEDLEPFRRMNADPRVMEFYPSVLTAEQSDDIVRRTERHIETHGFGLFALESRNSGAFLGFVGLQWVPFQAKFTPAVEIGWRIAHEHWNLGFATEAARAVLEFGFSELGLREVVAMTFVGNHRSRRVMEKLGMTHDSADDFDNPHPSLEESPLKPHVLYRIKGGSDPRKS